MPVKGAQLQRFVIDCAQSILQSPRQNDTQSNDATKKVYAVQAGQDVKETALQRRWQINACIHKLLPRGELPRQKRQAQHTPGCKPSLHALQVAPSNGT